MAIKIIRKTAPVVVIPEVELPPKTPTPDTPVAAPEPAPAPQAPAPSHGTETILDALATYSASSKKKVLMLVHKVTGNSWKVLHYDHGTLRVKLQNSAGLTISPILSQRESELYYPLWR